MMVKNAGMSALAGVLFVLALPGYNLWFCAYFGVALLFYSFDQFKPCFSAIICGFIYHLVGLLWISVPMTVFGGAPYAAGLLLVILIGAAGSLLIFAPFSLVYEKTRSPVLSAVVFIVLEMLKSRFLFGGLPWLNIAQTQHNNLPVLQFAAFTGEFGLSFLVMLTGFSIYDNIRSIIQNRCFSKSAVFLVFFVFVMSFGALRLHMSSLNGIEYTARAVQTGVKQEFKWSEEKRDEIINSLIAEIGKAANGSYDVLVMPETTFPVSPFARSDTRSFLTDISRNGPVIFGLERGQLNTLQGKQKVDIFNSAMLLDKDNYTIYDKRKLAPFGEYFPLAPLTNPIRNYFFGSSGDFLSGGKETLFIIQTNQGHLQIGIAICFEGAFSELMREKVEKGAQAFAVISNDSWFGESAGREQNLAINKLRAVEYGRYLIRSTQDGISGLADPYGRFQKMPEKIFYYKDFRFKGISPKTFFTKFGYAWFVILLLGYLIYYGRKKVLNKPFK